MSPCTFIAINRCENCESDEIRPLILDPKVKEDENSLWVCASCNAPAECPECYKVKPEIKRRYGK